MRKLICAFACLVCLASSAGQINITYTVTDFGLTTGAVSRVTLQPLAKGGDYSGVFLAPTTMSPDTWTNGTAVFSNKVAGYAYRVNFQTLFSTTSRTNYFPTALSGDVSGIDYVGWVAGFASDGSVVQFAYEYPTNLTALISSNSVAAGANITVTTNLNSYTVAAASTLATDAEVLAATNDLQTAITTQIGAATNGFASETYVDTATNDLATVIGAGYQPLSAFLTDVANLTLNQGDVFYYNGSDIVKLSPGSSGEFLQTQGAGANPQWATPSGAGDVVASGTLTNGLYVVGVGGTTVKTIDAAEMIAGLNLDALYQGLDSDLTDLADGTLTGSKIGAGIPWASLPSGILTNNYASAVTFSNNVTVSSGNFFLGGGSALTVTNRPYGTGWDSDTTPANKNDVYDKIESISAAGVSDGDKGDVIVTSSGTVWTMDTAAVEGPLEAVLDLSDMQGTLTDGQLSTNVPLKNAANTFSTNQTINGQLYIAHTNQPVIDLDNFYTGSSSFAAMPWQVNSSGAGGKTLTGVHLTAVNSGDPGASGISVTGLKIDMDDTSDGASGAGTTQNFIGAQFGGTITDTAQNHQGTYNLVGVYAKSVETDGGSNWTATNRYSLVAEDDVLIETGKRLYFEGAYNGTTLTPGDSFVSYAGGSLGFTIDGTERATITSSGVSGDGSGLTNLPAANTVAGSDTRVQYNSSGAFGSDASFTFDDETGLLRVGAVAEGVDIYTNGNLTVNGTLSAASPSFSGTLGAAAITATGAATVGSLSSDGAIASTGASASLQVGGRLTKDWVYTNAVDCSAGVPSSWYWFTNADGAIPLYGTPVEGLQIGMFAGNTNESAQAVTLTFGFDFTNRTDQTAGNAISIPAGHYTVGTFTYLNSAWWFDYQPSPNDNLTAITTAGDAPAAGMALQSTGSGSALYWGYSTNVGGQKIWSLPTATSAATNFVFNLNSTNANNLTWLTETNLNLIPTNLSPGFECFAMIHATNTAIWVSIPTNNSIWMNTNGWTFDGAVSFTNLVAEDKSLGLSMVVDGIGKLILSQKTSEWP